VPPVEVPESGGKGGGGKEGDRGEESTRYDRIYLKCRRMKNMGRLLQKWVRVEDHRGGG